MPVWFTCTPRHGAGFCTGTTDRKPGQSDWLDWAAQTCKICWHGGTLAGDGSHISYPGDFCSQPNLNCEVKSKKVCLLNICNSIFTHVYCLFDFIEAEIFNLFGWDCNPLFCMSDLRIVGRGSQYPGQPWPLSPDIKEEWRQNMQNNAITGSWTLGTQPQDKPSSLPRMLQGQKVTPASGDFHPLEMWSYWGATHQHNPGRSLLSSL